MIALIAAVAKNNVIGKANNLPWYLPEDLKHFRDLTTGHICIMGRKTYESIIARLGKPLPNRKTVVITSSPDYTTPAEVEKYPTLSEAISAQNNDNIFLIGGQRIFEEGLPIADTLYLTELTQNYDGDVYFPEFNRENWNREVNESHPEFDFVTYTHK